MRGLTVAEREYLLDAAIPSVESWSDDTHTEDYPVEILCALERRGLIRWVGRDDGEWEWEESTITEMGRLALRCCTVEGRSVLA